MLALKIIWWIAVFVIFWAMIGYPASLLILNKLFRKRNKKDTSYEPTVTIMVVAHNEEKVIGEKLQNLLDTDYPADKLEFLIASDFSTDKTDEIVEQFIAAHPEHRIRIHKSVNHYGKTNAQNETQELCDTEILVMTDANAMFEPNAVREIVSYFTDPDIAYVSGQLRYMNTEGNKTANSEGFYWKLDLMCRNIESRFQTITAGNGAIYAVRNKDYEKIPPIQCHDSSFPIVYALEKKRAIYNPEAIAYEKAGEVNEDEFKRKVRMNRIILRGICPDIRIFNVFAYHWFSYFYFGHRTCRYLLWLMHLLALVVNIPLLIDEIESNESIKGESFGEKIINAISINDIAGSGFSEFETYGTYVTNRVKDLYVIRDWKSMRHGGLFFDGSKSISPSARTWLSTSYDAISFEKGDYLSSLSRIINDKYIRSFNANSLEKLSFLIRAERKILRKR